MTRKAHVLMITMAMAWTSFLVQEAAAIAIVLTGGDPADGYVAPATALVAYDLAGGGTTIQGITFNGWDGNGTPAVVPAGLTVAGGGGAGYFGTFGQSAGSPFSGSADDNAMGSLLDTQAYGLFAPMEFTIGGLANGFYRVDQFFYAIDSGGQETFTINGVLVGTGPSNNGPYVEEDIVHVTGGTLVLSDGNGTVVTRLNGFAISAVVPEPGSLSLFAMGAAGMLLLKRLRNLRIAIG